MPDRLIPDSRQVGLFILFVIHVPKPFWAVIFVTPCPAPMILIFLSLRVMALMEHEPELMLMVAPAAAAEIAVFKLDVMSPIHATVVWACADEAQSRLIRLTKRSLLR